jgi:hypothetical protein
MKKVFLETCRAKPRCPTHCRVTTGRNGDVGRGAFFRFLLATSTHRYALTTNPFPASAPLVMHSSQSCARRNGQVTRELSISSKEIVMSVEGKVKEGAGFIKEEMNEHGKSPESQKKAQEGRDLRNEGRIEDGKPPKTTKPGTGH